MAQLETPVAFVVFNRPEKTRQSFEPIAQARPKTLLVVADGPRNAEEAILCEETRRGILDRIDWTCDVRTRFAASNLGPRYGPATGLSWVFDQVEESIVLEDDCVAGPSFFRFCSDLLARYRDEPRVMEIGGSNYQFGRWRGDYSYYFSMHAHTHGWATWRRAWRYFDPDIVEWPALRESGLVQAWCPDPREAEYWTWIFDGIYAGGFSTWDYQWVLTRWAHGGLGAVPNRNLVTNIGHGADATHTKGELDFLGMPLEEMDEISHPTAVVQDREADRFMFEQHFAKSAPAPPPGMLRSLAGRAKRWVRSRLPGG